jgi:hypothetical protein
MPKLDLFFKKITLRSLRLEAIDNSLDLVGKITVIAVMASLR